MGNLVTPKTLFIWEIVEQAQGYLWGLVAGSNATVTFYGDSSLTERPMDRIISPLEEMGARIVCNDIRNS